MNELALTFFGVVMAALGWFLKGLFGPSVDHFGNSLKEYFQNRNKDEYYAYKLYQSLEEKIVELHSKHGHNYFHENEPHLSNSAINEVVLKSDKKLLQKAVKQWIKYGKIRSFAQSDIFFAGMELLKEYIKIEDVRNIYDSHRTNGQTNVWPFLEKIESYKPKLLDAEMLDYLKHEQEKWKEKQLKRR